MAIKVQCPGCNKILSAQDSYHHKIMKCPNCGANFEALTVEESSTKGKPQLQGGTGTRLLGFLKTAGKQIKRDIQKDIERDRQLKALRAQEKAATEKTLSAKDEPLVQCGFCHATMHPIVKEKISRRGWLIFSVLLVFFCPLCWIGLRRKKEKLICSVCGKNMRDNWKIAYQREAIPKAVQREVWERDDGRCVECGSMGKLEFDHIIPVSRGGSSTVKNIQLLCQHCNRRKSGKEPGHY